MEAFVLTLGRTGTTGTAGAAGRVDDLPVAVGVALVALAAVPALERCAETGVVGVGDVAVSGGGIVEGGALEVDAVSRLTYSVCSSCCSTGKETATLSAFKGFLLLLDLAVLVGNSSSGLENQGSYK